MPKSIFELRRSAAKQRLWRQQRFEVVILFGRCRKSGLIGVICSETRASYLDEVVCVVGGGCHLEWRVH